MGKWHFSTTILVLRMLHVAALHKSFSPLRGQSKTVRPHTHTHTHTHILYIHTTEYTLYGVLYDIDIDILIFPI